MVLGCRTHQTRAANVDQLDRIRRKACGLCLAAQLAPIALKRSNDSLKWIEIDDDRIELLDAVMPQHLQIVGPIAASQNAGKDVWVERFHAAVENLWKARDGRDIFNLQPIAGHGCTGTAGAGHSHASGFEAASQTFQPRLIKDTHQHATNWNSVHRLRALRIVMVSVRARRTLRAIDAIHGGN